MRRAKTFTVAAIAFVFGTAAAAPLVTYESPCECRDAHGKARLAVKNDPSTPQADARAIQAVTPSDVFSWPGPDVHLTGQSGLTGIENKWYTLTGRVVALKVEADGDLHIALSDATADKPGIVVVEVPAKPHKKWCELRKIVFSWTHAKFPFSVRSGRKLKITEPQIITVTGKAFFDINHAPADQSNRRTDLPDYAAWESHPVMALHVGFDG